MVQRYHSYYSSLLVSDSGKGGNWFGKARWLVGGGAWGSSYPWLSSWYQPATLWLGQSGEGPAKCTHPPRLRRIFKPFSHSHHGAVPLSYYTSQDVPGTRVTPIPAIMKRETTANPSFFCQDKGIYLKALVELTEITLVHICVGSFQ